MSLVDSFSAHLQIHDGRFPLADGDGFLLLGIARCALPGFEDVIAWWSGADGKCAVVGDGGEEGGGADVNDAVHVAMDGAEEADEAGFLEGDAFARRGTPEAKVKLLGGGL